MAAAEAAAAAAAEAEVAAEAEAEAEAEALRSASAVIPELAALTALTAALGQPVPDPIPVPVVPVPVVPVPPAVAVTPELAVKMALALALPVPVVACPAQQIVLRCEAAAQAAASFHHCEAHCHLEKSPAPWRGKRPYPGAMRHAGGCGTGSARG